MVKIERNKSNEKLVPTNDKDQRCGKECYIFVPQYRFYKKKKKKFIN